MLTQELSVEIRVLARQGMSIRAIAQQLRVSRNTVRKYLRNPGLPIYPSRAARPTIDGRPGLPSPQSMKVSQVEIAAIDLDFNRGYRLYP